MNPWPEISVVAPLHNEAGNVQTLVRKILGAFSPSAHTIEVILVDDASTEDTWREVLRAQEANPQVHGIRHVKNLGQSAALFSGFRASRGRVIATLDGDLQNDPADLPRMVAELAHSDMVCGVRTARADGRLRRLSSGVARWARKLALRVDFADTGCNLRVFKKGVLDALPAFRGAHRFLPILAHSAGAVVREIPVVHHPRVAGRSKYGVWNRLGCGILDLIMVALFIRRQIPLDLQRLGREGVYQANQPRTAGLAAMSERGREA
ncbi:MAG TPA: glycosyltransferase family 2 protein [Candidatus Sulfotelmatobacter sp.]|nr:glycosyltransferase family 2 protein [Candidatus Sulfotelmatobacter sp.]